MRGLLSMLTVACVGMSLFGALFYLVSVPGCGCSSVGPRISFGDDKYNGVPGEYRLRIIDATHAMELSQFDVVVLGGPKNSTEGKVVVIARTSLDVLERSGALNGDFGITFSDISSEGRLSRGDSFTLIGVEEDQSYLVLVYWKGSGDDITGRSGLVNS